MHNCAHINLHIIIGLQFMYKFTFKTEFSDFYKKPSKIIKNVKNPYFCKLGCCFNQLKIPKNTIFCKVNRKCGYG